MMTTTIKSEVFLQDCMEGMKQFPDKHFELAIVDPEYGRGEHGGVDRSSMVLQKNGSRKFVNGAKYQKKGWDAHPANTAYFIELLRVSKNQIIWGSNYYPFNFGGSGRIVWDKLNDGSDQSDCEIAYNSLTDRVDLFRFMWRGMMQGSPEDGTKMQGNKALNEARIHPCQKPTALYRWSLKNYAKPGDKILDTHMGSQSSRIAAYDMGFDYTGFELDPDYFAAGCKRFEQHKSQLNLFR